LKILYNKCKIAFEDRVKVQRMDLKCFKNTKVTDDIIHAPDKRMVGFHEPRHFSGNLWAFMWPFKARANTSCSSTNHISVTLACEQNRKHESD
jgi:hypothetical protein